MTPTKGQIVFRVIDGWGSSPLELCQIEVVSVTAKNVKVKPCKGSHYKTNFVPAHFSASFSDTAHEAYTRYIASQEEQIEALKKKSEQAQGMMLLHAVSAGFEALSAEADRREKAKP